MNRILPLLLNQKCVYWPKGPVDSFGNYNPGVPVQLDCKYIRDANEIVSKDGRVLSTSITIYLVTPVEVDGWVWIGKITNAPISPSDPSTGSYIIRKVTTTEDTENDETLYTVIA